MDKSKVLERTNRKNQLLSPLLNGNHEVFIMCQDCWILKPMNIEFFLKRFGDQMHFGMNLKPKAFRCKRCNGYSFIFIEADFYLGDIARIGDGYFKNKIMPRGEVPQAQIVYAHVEGEL